MNGGHDVGGMDGFDLPALNPDQPVFKQEWERLVFGAAVSLTISLKSPWSLDELRFIREGMDPADYLTAPYYGVWLYAIEKLVVKYGLATEEELHNPDSAIARLTTEERLQLLGNYTPAKLDQDIAPKFSVDASVTVRNEHPIGHTRVPRYIRGRQGTIARDHGVYVFSDSNAVGLGPNPQHCYSVMFNAGEVWGQRANARDRVYVDLWDDHLDAAVTGSGA